MRVGRLRSLAEIRGTRRTTWSPEDGVWPQLFPGPSQSGEGKVEQASEISFIRQQSVRPGENRHQQTLVLCSYRTRQAQGDRTG